MRKSSLLLYLWVGEEPTPKGLKLQEFQALTTETKEENTMLQFNRIGHADRGLLLSAAFIAVCALIVLLVCVGVHS